MYFFIAGTFLHIMATTSLRIFGGGSTTVDGTPTDVSDAINLAKDLAQLKENDVGRRDSLASIAGTTTGDESSTTLRRQKTIAKLARNTTKKNHIAVNLDDAFGQRFQKLADELEDEAKTAEDISRDVMGKSKKRNAYKSMRAIAHMQTMTRQGTSHPKRKMTGASNGDIEMSEADTAPSSPGVRFAEPAPGGTSTDEMTRHEKTMSRCDSLDDVADEEHPAYEDPAGMLNG